MSEENRNLLENDESILESFEAIDNMQRLSSNHIIVHPVTPDSSRPEVLDGRMKFNFFVMMMLQLLNSVDRGFIPGTLGSIKEDLKLTGTEAGSLNSAFLAGMISAIPFFTWVSGKTDQPLRLISAGFSIWLIATLLAGFTQSYIQFIACRLFVGIGDAVFAVVAVPFVDYNAPTHSRARWMALFLSLYPIGNALGTVLGGMLRSKPEHWRLGFFLEAAMLTPFVIAGFLIKLRQDLSKRSKQQPSYDFDYHQRNMGYQPSCKTRFVNAYRRLEPALANPLAWLGSFAFAGLMGVSSGVGYWSPQYAVVELKAKAENAGAGFGIALVIGSIFGTVLGGKLLDTLGMRQGGKSCALAFTIVAVATAVCMPTFMAAYSVKSFFPFITLIALGMTALMVAGSNLSLGVMWTVPVQFRIVISGLSSLVMNLCGSVPGPIIVGYVVDKVSTPTNKFPHQVMLSVVCWLVWPIGLSALIAYLAKKNGIGSNVDKENR